MADYKLGSLDKAGKTAIHIAFTNEEHDGIVVEDAIMRRCRLENLGLKQAVFKKCGITHSQVIDCYMRQARFDEVDFTGSYFVNCNLEKAKLHMCQFDYATFTRCRLNVDEMLGCLPESPNLKRRMLREIRRNQESMGEKRSADILLLRELKAERDELREILRGRTSYYKGRLAEEGGFQHVGGC